MATSQIETVSTGQDKAKLAAVVLLVVGAVAGFYLLSKQGPMVQWGALIAGLILAAVVFLVSEPGRQLWQPGVLPLMERWQSLVGVDEAFAACKARTLGYGGRIRFGAWFGGDRKPFGSAERVVLVLEPDGRTDMKALAADLHALQKQLPGEWKQQDLGGKKVEVIRRGEDEMTGPTLVGDSIVVALASHGPVAEPLAAATAMASTATGKAPPPNTPALRVEIDLPALLAAAIKDGDADDQAQMRALGVLSLGRLQLSIGTAGPRVMAEVAQQFTPAPAGLFAAFCPPVQGVPAIRAAAPAQGTWRVGHLDLVALYDTVMAAMATWNRSGDPSPREEAKKELGLDPGPDLLAHATTELLVFGSPLLTFDRPDDFSWTVALRLKDEAKFAAGLATLLAHSKPFLNHGDTVDIEGIRCERYGNPINYKLWIGVGRGTCFVAGGSEAEAQLRAAITAMKAPPADGKSDEATKAFADLAKWLPPGVNTEAKGDLDSLFQLPAEVWWMMLREVLPFARNAGANDDPDTREQARALLQKHGLGTLRTATGYADATWRWRLYW